MHFNNDSLSLELETCKSVNGVEVSWDKIHRQHITRSVTVRPLQPYFHFLVLLHLLQGCEGLLEAIQTVTG